MGFNSGFKGLNRFRRELALPSHIDTPDIDTRKSRSHTRDLLALDHEMYL